MEVKQNPFAHTLKTLNVDGKEHRYYSLTDLDAERVARLPYSIRVLLESALRNCDEFNVTKQDVEKILDWKTNSLKQIEIPFKPARVLLQDFTGVPCVVDLAGMRDAMKTLGGDPNKINPQCPVDLVIDHSVQVDFSRVKDARERNEQIEFERNYERFQFLKWGQKTFDNFLIVPPGSGIVHQVNLEFLARVVFDGEIAYPDSVVGTDSHTPMVNGLGVVGWGVGGIEAESAMLGQVMSMVLPEVVGFRLTGELQSTVTATDLVLTVTQILRNKKVVGKFVEFFGPGVQNLTISDRATVSNMTPEYGATIGFFPVDKITLEYLQTTNRDPARIRLIEQYLRAQNLFRTYANDEQEPEFTTLVELDLSTVVPCVAGPKRPQDRVPLTQMKEDWQSCIHNPVGFKGYGLTEEQRTKSAILNYQGHQYTLRQGSVVIAAITSCTNTSNPSVMIAAGLVCKNAISKGLNVAPYIKTSLSPGSGVVTQYFAESGLQQYCDELGFSVAGFGCMTCIGNSGDLYEEVTEVLTKEDLVVSAVLSGNRNFEGRVHPLTRANYLASPPLVVAYALAGTVDIDFEKEPIGRDATGNEIFLKDIWPSRAEINAVVNEIVNAKMYKEVYDKIAIGTERWNKMEVPTGSLYEWSEASTYIQDPPFFKNIQKQRAAIPDINNAYCLGYFADFITTDHISPAGKISKNSPAAKFLLDRGVDVRDFNSYGARRGNFQIMARGTFANNRIKNILLNNKEGPYTLHVPTNEEVFFFDAASRYLENNQPTIILAGREYGSGSSRDWAAKGPYLLGVKAVIAESYERIHRSNLVGMGILPLQYQEGESAQTLGLTGKEQFSISLNNGDLKVHQNLEVRTNTGITFTAVVRIDTAVELAYYQNGGILNYVLRVLLEQK